MRLSSFNQIVFESDGSDVEIRAWLDAHHIYGEGDRDNCFYFDPDALTALLVKCFHLFKGVDVPHALAKLEQDLDELKRMVEVCSTSSQEVRDYWQRLYDQRMSRLVSLRKAVSQ